MLVDALRTIDERFKDLPGFPFEPNYLFDFPNFEGLRLHYLDEHRTGQLTYLCLHGQPTWSYLYRRMIPVFKAAGHRVVVPDLFGFGRSDKPIDEDVYTFDFHRNTLKHLIIALDLRNIVLVCQDWGGILGLTLPMEFPSRFIGLFIMDTLIGIGDSPEKSFLEWLSYSNRTPDMDVGKLLSRACPHLTEGEAAAYNAPFPDARFKSGVRRFPNLVPKSPNDPGANISRQALEWLRTEWSGKSFMAIGMKDPVLSPESMHLLSSHIRNCLPPLEVAEAGHFVQEWGEEIALAGIDTLAL